MALERIETRVDAVALRPLPRLSGIFHQNKD